jgi:CrcB protein
MAAPSPLIASLHVALGGAMGSVLRYLLGRSMTQWLGPQTISAFPWATLTVNIVGSLAMGLLAGWIGRMGEAGEPYRLLLGVGLLGGFTTFSAFSLELMMLIERGQAGQAFIYGAVSVLAGLSALYVGLILVRLATA